MRVCHVLESAGGGSGQVVVDLVRAGVAAADGVTVIYAPGRAESGFVESLTRIEGVEIVQLPMSRGIGASDAVAAWRLRRHLRRLGPFDVVHGHSSKAGALVRVAAIGMRSTRKVYTPHCFATMDPNAPSLYFHIEKALSRLSDAIVVVSNDELHHAVRRLGIAGRKLALITNGIGSEASAGRTAIRSKLGFAEKDVVLGFVGRLAAQKNPARLIDAFCIAQRGHQSLRLVIVGDGPMRTEIERQIARYGVERLVSCLGHRSGRDVIAGFDALVCSSDFEGFPVVYLEALAAGVPIITTPVGGTRECVVPGRTGFVAAGHTAERMAQAISEFASLCPTARKQMSEHCRSHAHSFRLNDVARATRDLYVRLIGKRTSADWRQLDAAS
jgi:glycosyltransferase involved in cell wall biosynthesis